MMPSRWNLLAPRLSILAGDAIEVDRSAALALGQRRAMERGRQSVRPAHADGGGILLWLVQDVRFVAPRPEVHEEIAEQVHAC